MSRWGVARAKLDEGDLVPEDADFPKEKVTSQKILELFGTAGTTQTMKMLQERSKLHGMYAEFCGPQDSHLRSVK